MREIAPGLRSERKKGDKIMWMKERLSFLERTFQPSLSPTQSLTISPFYSGVKNTRVANDNWILNRDDAISITQLLV